MCFLRFSGVGLGHWNRVGGGARINKNGACPAFKETIMLRGWYGIRTVSSLSDRMRPATHPVEFAKARKHATASSALAVYPLRRTSRKSKREINTKDSSYPADKGRRSKILDYKTPPAYPAFLRRLTGKTNKLLYINAKMNFSKPRFSGQQSSTRGLPR